MMRGIAGGDLATLRERVEVLDGSRRLGPRGRAALRVDDLAGLLTLPDTLKSEKAAGSTVTKAEFDALVEDVHAIHRRLRVLATAVQARRSP